MLVKLAELKPNPMRDFKLDPINEDRVKDLTACIQQDGFWGGVVCARRGDDLYIAAGHHRTAAALRAGVTSANLLVIEAPSDLSLWRILARENRLQRGDQSAAMLGEVGGAVRLLAKSILTGESCTPQLWSADRLKSARGHLLSERGLGVPLVLDFLNGPEEPGQNGNLKVPRRVVEQTLTALKKSAHYHRIISEVHEELAQEAAERAAELERAEAERIAAEERKAEQEAEEFRIREEQARAAAERAEQARAAAERAEAAAPKDELFKAAEVSAAFKNAHQVEEFRKLVVDDEKMRQYVPLESQPEIARKIAALAEEQGEELSGVFIRCNVGAAVAGLQLAERQRSAEERAALLFYDRRARVVDAQEKCVYHLQTVRKSARNVIEGMAQWRAECPPEAPFPMDPTLRREIEETQERLKSLHKEIGG